MKDKLKRKNKLDKKKKRWIILGIIAAVLIIWFSIMPSNNRNWASNVDVLAYADINDDQIDIYNIRNFTYITPDNYTPTYYNATYSLNELSSLDFIYEPYSKWKGAAHTFFSFGFSDGRHVAISVEIRNEVNEEYSAIKGLFKQYEIMYRIGDENDLIKLRTNYRKNPVYLYPVKTSKEKIRLLFVDMIKRTNKLKDHPEFYNTLTSTCTTNLVRHVNHVSPHKIHLTYKYYLPGYADKLAYELGYIMTNQSYAESKYYYQINELALKFADSPDFSKKIRNKS